MSAPIIQHREALRTARSRQHPSAIEREWRQPPPRPLRIVRTAAPSCMQRFAAACWRAHDQMHGVWVVLGAAVLIGAALATYGIAACFFGWPL